MALVLVSEEQKEAGVQTPAWLLQCNSVGETPRGGHGGMSVWAETWEDTLESECQQFCPILRSKCW